MKIYAIYKDNNFIIAFPTREETENYGKVVLGLESGWEYDIKEMWMYETKQYPYPFSQPLTQPITTPYTPPIPLKPSTPYPPHNPIWCEGTKATYDNKPFTQGTK